MEEAGFIVINVGAGIIDPTKVTRAALQNAANIAGLLLTTEALITEVPEKDKKPDMPGGLICIRPLWGEEAESAILPLFISHSCQGQDSCFYPSGKKTIHK